MKLWRISALLLLTAPPLQAADVPATLQWSRRVELSVPVAGVVHSVNVDVGDQVKKGQVLLALENAKYQARVMESQAAITRLVAELAEARRDFERVKELHERTVVATAELDQSQLRLTRAESLLAEARASLKQQQAMLEDTVVRAPLDALVIARQAEPGMSVAVGMQPPVLLVLAKAGEMLARLYLPAAQLENMKVGQAVTVEVGGKSYPGKIKSLGLEPVKIKDESAYQLDVVFATRGQFRAGLTALVRLP